MLYNVGLFLITDFMFVKVLLGRPYFSLDRLMETEKSAGQSDQGNF